MRKNILNSMVSGRFNGREVIEVKYNNEIIWCNNIYNIHAMEYMVSSDTSYFLSDYDHSTGDYYALPKFKLNDGMIVVPGVDSKYPITILLKNGNETSNINTPISDIEKITIHYDGTISSILYTNNTEITEIRLGKTDNLTSLTRMFSGCTKLETIKFPNFTTNGISNMSYMFSNCTSLKSLDLSTWSTNNVTDMSYMFSNCTSLDTLNISNWDTTRATITLNMFQNVPSDITWIYDFYDYEKVNLKESITKFSSRFPWNSDLIYTIDRNSGRFFGSYVDLGSGSSKTADKPMLRHAQSLDDKTVKLVLDDGRTVPESSSIHTRNIKYVLVKSSIIEKIDFSYTIIKELLKVNRVLTLTQSNTIFSTPPLTFRECKSLKSVDLSNFDTSNVTDMHSMFNGCSSLTTLNVSSFNTSNVTDMGYMFNDCSSLTTLNVSSFNTSNVTDMSYMFDSCSSLTSLDLSNFDTSNVTDMSSMFFRCSSLTTLNVSSFNTSNVTTMSSMFYGCSSLTTLNVSSFNTSNVTDMGWMFYGCTSLTSLDISMFNTNGVTTYSNIFGGQVKANIYVSDENFTLDESKLGTLFKGTIIRI